MKTAIEKICDFYLQFQAGDLSGLDITYSPYIEFIDPAHSITGINALREYFKGLMENLEYCEFDIHSVMEQETEAYMQWTMNFRHPRLNKGKNISLEGISHFKFDSRVTYHRDYFDLGKMVYENVPVLGRIIRMLKKGLTS